MTTNPVPKATKPARVIPADANVTVLPSLPVKPEKLDPVSPGPKKKKAAPKRGLLHKLAFRHRMIAMAFFAMVAIPTALTTFYMAFIANDQYHSSASFSVRSIQTSSGADILGMFTQSAAGSTASDSFVLLDYIVSQRMVEALERNFDLSKIYGRHDADFFYTLSSNEPIEDKLKYWRSMVDVNYDNASGIINLRVRAFEPETAEQLAAFIVAQSEELVNDLSKKAREAVLVTSQNEVKLAEQRLSQMRNALRKFRGDSQEVSPEEGAKLASQIVASLEQQLVQLNTDLSTARTQMDSDSPRIRVLVSKIASIEKQLEVERQRFGKGDEKTGRLQNDGDVASRIYQYETLETEREFAERAYTTALAGLEKARIDASAQQRYLAVFINPTVSELAQYPTRLTNILLVVLGGLFAWGVAVLVYYNIRDRN